jgi:hypothetical protein
MTAIIIPFVRRPRVVRNVWMEMALFWALVPIIMLAVAFYPLDKSDDDSA